MEKNLFNTKDIRKQMNNTTISEEEVLKSNAFKEMIITIINVVTRLYSRNIDFQLELDNPNGFVAYTNNEIIVVNGNHEWLQKMSLKDKIYGIIGIVLHETGHLLWTNFRQLEAAIISLSVDGLLAPDVNGYQKAKDFIKKNRGIFVSLYKTFDNCIEDGFIEKLLLKYFPGYGSCLISIRDIHEKELTNKPYNGANNLNEALSSIINLSLCYAKYGKINIKEGVNDKVVVSFNKMMPVLDKALEERNSLERRKLINEAFLIMVEFFLEEFSKSKSNNSGKTNDSGESDNSGKADDSGKSSNSGKVDDSGKSDKNSSNSSEGTGSGSSESNGSADMSPDKLEKALEDVINKMGDSLDSLSENTKRYNPPKIQASENNEGNPSGKTSKITPENIVEQVKLEKVINNKKTELERQLQKLANESSNIHHQRFASGCNINLSPIGIIKNIPNKRDYDNIARRTMKDLDKIIKERQIGDEENGLFFGQELDSDNLYRNDKKVFKSKILPEDIPDMEILMMIDLSGSMSGDKISKARESAYITWKFCQMMNIPISIYGHNGNSSVCNIYKAVDSYEPKQDADNIFMLSSRASNYDSIAMKFAVDRLNLSEAKDKLLIFISDGMPCYASCIGGDRYYDIHSVVEEAKKLNINIITAAVDEPAEIKNVYFNNVPTKKQPKFMDLSDMKRLPKAFVEVVKKLL